DFGRTPLHWAVVNGHRDVVEFLLKHDFGSSSSSSRSSNSSTVDPSIRDKNNETALELAERRALCANAADRGGGGLPASLFGGIAKLLGGSGSTKNLQEKKVAP
ncbi:unnamed protein product, partial [Amoebophrya sp. A25]